MNDVIGNDASRGLDSEMQLDDVEIVLTRVLQARMLLRDLAAEKRAKAIESKRAAVADATADTALLLTQLSDDDGPAGAAARTVPNESTALSEVGISDLAAILTERLTRRSRAMLVLIELVTFDPFPDRVRWVEQQRDESLREAASDFGSCLRDDDLDILTTEFDALRRALQRRSIRWGRIAAVGVVGVGAGILTGGLAAPAIGAMIGSTMGLSGAAATSAGLAALGGGSLAAGGFGVAGGTAMATGLGGLIGAGAAATGARYSRLGTAAVIDDAVRLDLIARVVLSDSPDRDEQRRRVVQSIQERINWVAARTNELTERIAELKRENAELKTELDRLRAELAVTEQAQTVLEVVAERVGGSAETTVSEAVDPTSDAEAGRDDPTACDDAELFDRNIDTQARRVATIDLAIDAASDDHPVPANLPVAPSEQSYRELSEFNDRLRAAAGWTTIDLDAALTPAQRTALAAWRQGQRTPWDADDFAAVGAAGTIGMLCVWFDTTADRGLTRLLQQVAESDRVRGWERAGKRLPIDHTGKGFGGRAHRVKSAGHDLIRFREALRQIRDGEFRGIDWTGEQPRAVTVSGRFQAVEGTTQAIGLLAKHLAADVVTPMSLPLPGFSLLAECDDERLRNFALHAYAGMGPAGSGWNLRSAVVIPTFTMTITEIVIRTHVYAEVYRRTGSAALTPAAARRRDELLLAGHALTASASFAKSAARAMLTAQGFAGAREIHPSTIRHLQIPTMIRAGALAADLATRSRPEAAASWDQLLTDCAQPWQLDEAAELDLLFDSAALAELREPVRD